MDRQQQLGGLVLAGGQGSRMGYVNKGLQILRGRHMVDYALAALQQTCDEVFISANQDVADYLQKGVGVLQDAECWQGCGPLAGVMTAQAHFAAKIATIQVLPCDSPLVDAAVVHTLSQALHEGNARAVYAQTPEQMHPVVFQFKREAWDDLQQFLQHASKHSIRKWLHRIGAQAVMFKDEALFRNINDQASLERLQTEGWENQSWR